MTDDKNAIKIRFAPSKGALQPVEVTNFPEQKTDIKVNNLSELAQYFESLAASLSESIKNLPNPNVVVNPADVVVPDIAIPEIRIPDIVVPETKVTIDDLNSKPLLDAIKSLKESIRKAAAKQDKQTTAFSSGINAAELKRALKASANASLATDVIFSGNQELTPKFAVIDAASAGDNTIVAAVTGKKIRVLDYSFVSSGTVTARWESGASGTALTGQMNFIASTGIAPGFTPIGHFETAEGALLNLELSGATSVDGHLTYVEV